MKKPSPAKKLASASINLASDQGQIEKLILPGNDQEQIRISLWRDGKMLPLPITLSEQELVDLLHSAIHEGVLSRKFIADLHSIIEI